MRRAGGIVPAGLLILAASAAVHAEPELLRAVDLGGLETRSAALILSGEEGGELDVSVLPVPLTAHAERVWVGLVIDVEGDEGGMGEPLAGQPLVTEVYAYALDAGQELGGYLTQAFRLDPAERRGVKFFGHLELAPGDYSLRVLVLRRQRERLGLRVVPLRVPSVGELAEPDLVPEPPESWVLVREAERPGEPVFPPVVDGRILVPSTRPASVAEAAGVAAAATESVERRRGDLEARYADALRRLAAGDEAAARAALRALESAALGHGADVKVTAKLLAFAALLVDAEPGSLLPLVQVHEALYRRHYGQGRLGLATHSRRMVAGLAELDAAKSGPPATRRAVADAFASLAGFLQDLGSTPAAEVLFEGALGYDAGDEAALLGLAAIREAYGHPRQAADLLKRLLAAWPGNAEARLRRAVCLRRLGAAREAETLLGACLGDGNAPWIRAVAYQELAGLYVADGRYDDAVALLGEALARLDGPPRLHLQLAAVYDRLGHPAQARAALAELDPRAGRETDSPRLVYSRWPTWTIDAARRALDAAAAEHRPDLARALDAVGEP